MNSLSYTVIIKKRGNLCSNDQIGVLIEDAEIISDPIAKAYFSIIVLENIPWEFLKKEKVTSNRFFFDSISSIQVFKKF